MAQIKADLYQNGKLIESGVEIETTYYRQPVGGLLEIGTFATNTNTTLDLGKYEARLSDGKTGEIVLTSSSQHGNRSYYHFHVNRPFN